ncbi:MAG: pantoate--beta-alanine ligase [Candidatus Eremiobacteraeota bacterium]|nr:pantoate--beta-alanine ligase [Candidatus Eremiobacteraeota bacterium]
MEFVTQLGELRDRRAALPGAVGLVPTMGALHQGHAALVEQARRECAHVVVTIFVNPLQFGPSEDFTRYPRRMEEDRELLEGLGVDIVFAPEATEMFPQPPDIIVEPAVLGRYFEGERRPGHFRGVATVVLKLLNAVQPEHAYFGQKDAQQLAIIQRLALDLNIATKIHACATVREADGLALSSRNVYLSETERHAAPNLVAALREVVTRLGEGESDVTRVLAGARQRLAPLREDYLGVVDPAKFEPLRTAPPGMSLVAVGAAFAGATRLIDNLTVQTPAEREMVKR